MSTTEEPNKLYAAREPVFPRRVKGSFRTLKWWLMGLMLGVYYITPWIRWDRGPNLPDQAVLVDLVLAQLNAQAAVRACLLHGVADVAQGQV